MKKLFTVRNCMLLRVEEEGAVYSFYDNESKRRYFCNSEGTVLSQYEGSIHQVEDWINYDDGEEMRYNKYGVALADGCLVDQDGNQIPDTVLNCVDDCDENNRYFVFTLLSGNKNDLSTLAEQQSIFCCIFTIQKHGNMLQKMCLSASFDFLTLMVRMRLLKQQ